MTKHRQRTRRSPQRSAALDYSTRRTDAWCASQCRAPGAAASSRQRRQRRQRTHRRMSSSVVGSSVTTHATSAVLAATARKPPRQGCLAAAWRALRLLASPSRPPALPQAEYSVYQGVRGWLEMRHRSLLRGISAPSAAGRCRCRIIALCRHMLHGVARCCNALQRAHRRRRRAPAPAAGTHAVGSAPPRRRPKEAARRRMMARTRAAAAVRRHQQTLADSC